MPWFKVDDGFAFHPKTVHAGNAAAGFWVRAGAWSAANLTNGFIPVAVVPALGGTRPQAHRLVDAGLWLPESGGYRFHDWSTYQPNADDFKAGREAMSDGSRLANHKRWHVRKGIKNPNCPYCLADQVPD